MSISIKIFRIISRQMSENHDRENFEDLPAKRVFHLVFTIVCLASPKQRMHKLTRKNTKPPPNKAQHWGRVFMNIMKAFAKSILFVQMLFPRLQPEALSRFDTFYPSGARKILSSLHSLFFVKMILFSAIVPCLQAGWASWQ
jgi:hypothetical protein